VTPVVAADRFEQVECRTATALRRWLSRHHARHEGVWVVTWRKRPGAPYVSRWDVLDELLCFGWIDGPRRARPDGKTMQLCTPRRHDVWTATYRTRAERLIAEGRMAAPGAAAIARAKAAGTWRGLPTVDALAVPADLRRALSAAGGTRWFGAAAPSYRRNVLRWIAKAVKPETRAKRVAETARLAGLGRKVPQY
jgi:uncharacterized protein YdeI (YjbR/CyaY-like superfamily)